MGSAFHKAVELWYQGRNLTANALFALVPQAWREVMARSRVSPDVSQKTTQYHGQIAEMLQTFFASQRATDELREPMGVEKKFEIEWPTKVFGKDVMIVLNGFIDRIMGSSDGKEAWITDWKTQKDMPTQAEVDNNHQLTFYAAAYRWLSKKKADGSWPKMERYVELYFPRHGKSIYSTRSKPQFDELKSLLVKAVEIELTPDPVAKPTEDNCRYCDYFGTNHCPATKK